MLPQCIMAVLVLPIERKGSATPTAAGATPTQSIAPSQETAGRYSMVLQYSIIHIQYTYILYMYIPL